MKKLISLLIVFLLLVSFNVFAQETDQLNTEETSLEDLNLSQEKNFSQSAREELLGIASQFDSEEDQEIDQLTFENNNFSLTESTLGNSQQLNILKDLTLNADYSKEEDEKLETTADFQLEYALNSRTLLRAGYSILNEEWWDVQSNTVSAEEPPTADSDDNKADIVDNTAEDLSPDNNNPAASNNNVRKVYQNELESSRSLGLAYRSNDRVTLSADFIDNNEFGSYYDEDWELAGDSTVFGVEYNYPAGSSIRARYQVDTADDITQRVTGLDFDFNNLATFSASYKLLDLNQLAADLSQQKTAWDLGLGVNISENYGLNLGYERIETEDEEGAEQKVRASFEINF
jgi:hypothetical protein